jgi:hypothetical protein
MPYTIKKVKGGYKVADNNRTFSQRPLSKTMAEKQRIAIALSESRSTGKPASIYFA